MKPDDDAIDTAISDALRSMERSSSMSNLTRARHRQRMLSSYDAEVRNHSSVGSAGTVFDLVELSSEEGPNTDKRASWFLAAAAVLLILAMVAQSAVGSNNGRERILDSASGSTEPARLTPGSYRTNVLGTSIGFDLSEELWLIDERSDVIEVSTQPEGQKGSTMWFVRPDGTSSALGASTLEQAFEKGDARFSTQMTPVTIAGVESTSWLVTLSNSGIEAADCSDHETCIPLFERPSHVGLQTPGSNTVIVVPHAEADPLVIVIAMQSAGLDRSLQDLLASLQLGAPDTGE